MNTNIAMPKRAHIELTSACNFKCITCKHGYIQYGHDIDNNVCEVIIKEIIPNLEEIELQGTGESLLSKKFNRVFDSVLENKQCKITLITNASLLNKTIIKKFIDTNMQIVFSLDGSNEDIFHIHRPIGDFNKIVNNIRLISDMKQNMHSSNLSTVINMVLTKYNLYTLKEMIDFAKKMNIDYLFVSEVRPCMPDEKQWNNLRLNINQDDLLRIINSAKEYADVKKLGFSFNPYRINDVIKKKICPSPWSHIFVSADGDVSFCCELNHVFGNLKEKAFTDIWNSVHMNDFRNKMLLGEYHHRCMTCCLPWGITHE